MIRSALRFVVVVTSVLTAMDALTTVALQAQDEAAPAEIAPADPAPAAAPAARSFGQPDLFYNYYIPGGPGGVPGALYLAPRPVPPVVGHTYYTYQPLLPHEYMYQHQRRYYRYYDCGTGLTRTRVRYMRTPLLDRLLP